MSDLEEKLTEEFQNKEYAHGYMESFCVERLASQIYTLRMQKNMSQKELSSVSGINQEVISQLESGDPDCITIKTLNTLSRVFDVNLSIKFTTFSEAIKDMANLNVHALQVTPRNEDLSNQ